MGGPGRGSGLEAEQAGLGPGARSPSEPTVLRDVELPEPRGEAMTGAAEAAGIPNERSGVLPKCPLPQPPHSSHLANNLPEGFLLSSLLPGLGRVPPSPIKVVYELLASSLSTSTHLLLLLSHT